MRIGAKLYHIHFGMWLARAGSLQRCAQLIQYLGMAHLGWNCGP
jgi:hypothetical protein